MAHPRPLKLRARDLDDMAVIAAMLQDAVVRPAEMTYLAREKRFVMVVSRFRWEHPEAAALAAAGEAAAAEDGPEGGLAGDGTEGEERAEDVRFEDAGKRQLFERVNAGVCVDRVRRVRTQHLDLRNRDQVLSLLTVEIRPDALTLVFSGGALVRLELAGIACHLEDLGEPWPTPWRPSHGSEAGPGGGTGGGPSAGPGPEG
jgi:hypothetical protein